MHRTLSLALAPAAAMHPFTTRKLSARVVGVGVGASTSAVKPLEFNGSPVTIRL